MTSRFFLGRLVAPGRPPAADDRQRGAVGVTMAVAGVPVPAWLLAVLVVLLGLGLGVGQPLTMSWLAEMAPAGLRGRAMSLRLTGNRLGQVVIPSAVGAVAAGVGAAGVLGATAAALAVATRGARPGGRRPPTAPEDAARRSVTGRGQEPAGTADAPARRATTAAAKPRVPPCPPRSRVLVPAATAARTPSSTRRGGVGQARRRRRVPSQSSSMPCGQDHRDRVGEVRDRRCRGPTRARPAPWHRVVRAVDRRRDAERAGQLAGEVGEDVAEHVLGDEDVEVAAPAQQVHGHGVDVEVVDRDVRIALRPPRGRRRLKRPELSCSTLALCTIVSLLPPATGQLERRAGDPLDGRRG